MDPIYFTAQMSPHNIKHSKSVKIIMGLAHTKVLLVLLCLLTIMS